MSFDATKGGFQAMVAGKINVDVECSPLLGPQLMTAVKDVVAGKQLPKRIVTNETVFPMNVAAGVADAQVLSHVPTIRRGRRCRGRPGANRFEGGCMESPPVVEMIGIDKSFPGVNALQRVNFRLFPVKSTR